MAEGASLGAIGVSWSVPFVLLLGGATIYFLVARRRAGRWRSWLVSVVVGLLALSVVERTLKAITQSDLWGPPPRARLGEALEQSEIRSRIVDAAAGSKDATLSLGDWDGDGVSEFLRTKYVRTQKFYSHGSLQKIEVVSGSDDRLLGRVEFRMPFAVPKKCGDLDGDGFEEFAVEYGRDILIYGREGFR